MRVDIKQIKLGVRTVFISHVFYFLNSDVLTSGTC